MMGNISVLKDGLSIISQCKKETNDIWHAHFGAAAIASYFLRKIIKLMKKPHVIFILKRK